MESHVPGHASTMCGGLGYCSRGLSVYVWKLVAVWSVSEALEGCSDDWDWTTSQSHSSMFSVSRQVRVHMWH